MATLSNTKIKDTYQSLVKFNDNGNITTSAKRLTDGFGNNSPFYVSTTQIGIGVTPTLGYDLHVNSNAKIGGNLLVSGNLTVSGTLTYIDVEDLATEDPLIKLARNNTGNLLDIGFYGKYVQSTVTKYKGLFNDADDDKWKLFIGTSNEPTTVVNTSGTGYTTGTLVANLEGNVTGNLTGNVTGDLTGDVTGNLSGNVTGGTISGTTGTFTGAVSTGRNISLSSTDYTYIQGTHTGASDGEYVMRTFGYGDSTFYGSFDILRHDTDDGELRLRQRIAGTATDVLSIVDGNATFSGLVTGIAPTSDLNFATKKYVDDNIPTVTTPALSAVLAVGNTSGANDLLIADDQKLLLGDDSDFEIFKFGAGDNFIRSNTGHLYLQIEEDDHDMFFQGDDGSGGKTTYFFMDGSEERTKFLKNLEIVDNNKLILGSDDDSFLKYDTTDSQLFISGDSKFLNDVILSDGSLTVNQGNNLVKLSGGANSIGEIELKDGASVYLQGWGDSFRVAVNGDYTNRAFEIASDKSATFTGSLTGTSASFSSNLTATGNITTDGIFINNSAPDDEVVQFIQSGRKTALKTHFSSSATGSFLDFRISNGNVDGSFSTPLRLYPDRVDITTAEFDTIKTNNIAKLTTGSPITINSGADASNALRVYYDMQVYNTISFTNASWSNQGRISASSGILSLQGGSGTSTIFINSTDQVSIRNNADLGTYTRLGIAMDVSGNAANLDESTDYNAMSIAPYRVGSSYGMYFGGGHGANSSAGFIQSAKIDGTDSSTISLNPFGGAVGINTGTSDPSSTLHIKGSFRTHSTGTYPMGILNEFVSTTVSRTKFGNISTASNLEIYYDIAGTEEARITRNYTVAPLKFNRGNVTDMEITGTGNVLMGNTVINPASGFSNQKGFGYDKSTGNLQVASTSGTPMTIGRNESSAGEILELRKESNITHSFGTTDSYILSNVGILNNTPLARLTIGSSQGSSLDFSYDTTNGYRNNISNYWNSSIDTRMDFNIGRTANVAPVTVMSVGYNSRVGINTQTPDVDLQVTTAGTSSEDGIVKIGGSADSLGLVLEYDQAGATVSTITANPTYTSDTSYMKIRVDGDRNVNQLVLKGDGKVGINTGSGSPTTLLHLDQPSNDRAGGLYIERNGSNYGLAAFVNSGGYGVIGSNGSFTTDIITMDLNVGHVGIGISDPSAAKLVVNSSSNPQILVKKQTSGGGAEILFEHNSGGTQYASIKYAQDGDNQLYITTGYDSPNDLNRIYLQPGGETAMTLFGGNNSTGTAGTVTLNVNAWLNGYSVGTTQQNLIRSRAMGYPGYYGLQIGQETNHIALFIDPGSVSGGSFSGNINEIMIPNKVVFEQANSAGNNWLYGQSITLDNGKLGLGIMSPLTKFHIQDGTGGGNPTDSRTKLYIDSSGEAYIGVNVPTNSFGGMRLAAGGSNKAFFELYDNTTQGQKLSLGTIDARDVVINTTNTERLRIKTNGNVNLLNTSSTDSKHFGITNAAGTTGWTFGNGVIANSHQFVIYDNTAGDDRLLINSSGGVGINCDAGSYRLKIISTSSETAAIRVEKPYSSARNIASVVHGNNFIRNSYDTFTIAQTDVPCLVITETVAASNQGAEQRLTLTVGDNKCVIGTSSTVTTGMYFNVARSTSALGYQATNGITALHLTNNGDATFYANAIVPNSLYVGDYIYHKDDTNTYIRFEEDKFTFRTGGDDRVVLNTAALNIGPMTALSSTANDGPLRVVNNSTGQADMGRSSVAVQLGPKATRTATAGNYYGGITWNGLLNYSNGTGYDIAPHVWVGAKFKDFPGSERSSFVVGVKSGTGSTGSGNNIPVERLELDFSGNLSITGTFTATGDVIAYSDKRLKENIKPIDNALEKITKLEGVSYNRIDIDDKSNKVGFIAQDVKKILPEVVSDDEKYLGVNYGNITAVLVEAIKEQQKQIVSLQKEINNLKNK